MEGGILKMNTIKEYKQYFTPVELADFMVNMIPEQSINTVIDLSMGECGLLEAAKKRWVDASLFGADIDDTLVDKINLESPYINTFGGDSLADSLRHWELYRNVLDVEKFDLAIANPPFNYFDQKKIRLDNEKETSLSIEMRFLLKYIEIVREEGYICIIMPYGFLSLDQYSKVRKEILKKVEFIKVIKVFDRCIEKIDADTCLLLMQKRKNGDNLIQNEISLEYLTKEYILQQYLRIPVINATDRLDLEYNLSIKKNKSHFENCRFPISDLKNFTEKCIRGKTLAQNESCISEKGLRYLHTTDVKPFGVLSKMSRYVKRNNDYFKDSIVKSDTVIVGRVGKACIGKVTVLPEKIKQSAISDCLYGIEVKNLDPYFLGIYLLSSLGQTQFRGLARGSCSKYITKDDLMNLKVIVPEHDFQIYVRKKYLGILAKPGRTKKDVYIRELITEVEIYLGKGRI